MATEDCASEQKKELLSKAVNITWTPELEPPSEIRVESLRHRGVDRLRLAFGHKKHDRFFWAKWLHFGRSATESTDGTVITIADENLCLDHNGQKKTIALRNIKSVEIDGSEKRPGSSLTIETSQSTLQMGRGLQIHSLRWLRDRLLLEAAGLVWKPVFHVGKRTTARTVTPDHDTYADWSSERNSLIDFFVSQAPAQATALISAVESMDSEATKSSTKWLKSSCAVVGAGFLSELCQRIELDVVNQNSDRIAILVQNFETEFNKVLKRLCEISCKRVSDVGLLKESTSTSKIEPSPTSAGILLVEDSLVNQEVATSLLSVAGHQITVASNGTEALEFLQKRSFDIILMDCQMPGLDGMETTKRIRKSEFRHGHARTPIVALTANALNGDRMQCINADMDDHLSKPYSPDELLSIVDRWVAPRDQVDLPTNCDAIYSKAGQQ